MLGFPLPYTINRCLDVIIVFCIGKLAANNRWERVWPVSNSSLIVDLPQSSPFGPRLKASEGFRYDFHRGIDIPTPWNTSLVAIADGTVRINGSHSAYSDGVIQIRHSGWDDNCILSGSLRNCTSEGNGYHYATYLHVSKCFVNLEQSVRKGDIIGLSGVSASGFPHLHFEIRRGSVYQKSNVNPWHFLPTPGRRYVESFELSIASVVLGLDKLYNITVSVSCPPDDLTFDGIIGGFYGSDQLLKGENISFFFEAVNTLYDDVSILDMPILNGISLEIAPWVFSSESYELGESAGWNFTFFNLEVPHDADSWTCTIFDVFGKHKSTTVPLPRIQSSNTAPPTDVPVTCTSEDECPSGQKCVCLLPNEPLRHLRSSAQRHLHFGNIPTCICEEE